MLVKDMTTGSPLRMILSFALPMFIGTVFQQIYSIVDTMVAGYNLGDQAIAAIGATSSLYAFIIDFAFGMNSGFALVVTRAFGSHNEEKLRRSIGGMLLLDAIVTVVLTVTAILFLKPLMRLMNTPQSIFDDAYRYMLIICLGMITTLSFNMFSAILRAVGNSVTPLYFLVISCLANIGMDLLMIVVLHLGVAGAAIATVLAQALSAVLSGVYLLRRYQPFLPKKKDLRITMNLRRELFSNGLAMAFMYCVVDMGSVIFQGANNALGETFITSHTAARRIIGITMAPLGTISGATATFIGQNWGAKRLDRVKEGLRLELLLSIAWGVLICGLVYLFGAVMVRFTTGTNNTDVIRNAVMSLRLHLPFYPVLGALLALRTAMQAMDIKLAPVLSSSMELGMKIVAAIWLIPRMGFLGTCITEPITWLLCGLFLSIVYGNIHGKLDTNAASA